MFHGDLVLNCFGLLSRKPRPCFARRCASLGLPILPPLVAASAPGSLFRPVAAPGLDLLPSRGWGLGPPGLVSACCGVGPRSCSCFLRWLWLRPPRVLFLPLVAFDLGLASLVSFDPRLRRDFSSPLASSRLLGRPTDLPTYKASLPRPCMPNGSNSGA